MAKAIEKNKLEPTYGSFEAKGIISNIEDLKSGTTKDGVDYRSLKLTIKTDKNSSLKLEFFGMKEKQVEVVKFKGKTIEKKNVKWADRNNLEEGFAISNLRGVKLGFDSTKKDTLKTYVSFDAINEIVENFAEGDSISTGGSLRFTKFLNKKGDEVTISNYSVSKFYKIKELDFEEENFEPFVTFKQKIVIGSSEVNKEDGYLSVNAFIITDKNGSFVAQEFRILLDKREKMAKNFNKLKPYTVIPVTGNIVNKVILDESTDNEEDDGWGFDTNQQVVQGYDRYFEILAADATSLEEEKYEEEDFIVEDILADDIEDSDDDFDDISTSDDEDENDDWLAE